MKKTIYIWMILIASIGSSCNDFLDIVPDGVSTLDNAFSRRTEAKRYLFTCYSYMPEQGDVSTAMALWGDEMWTMENAIHYDFNLGAFNIARGLQNSNAPLLDHWGHYYQALRDCNIFLENLEDLSKVQDIEAWERAQWIAEAKFLKAYYHFCLVRMYGPVPLIRENLPITAPQEEVRVFRDPVDDCFDYIVQLLDEAMPDLPLSIINPVEELGRITRPIAASFKAKVLVFAASPLFNGNTDQAQLVNTKSDDPSPLFNQEWSIEKWNKALTACEEAVAMCEDELGLELYEYPGSAQYELSDTIILQLSLRNAFNERWNREIIWGNSKSRPTYIQEGTMPKLNPDYQEGARLSQSLCTPMKIGDQFYTDHGVPLEEDKTFDYETRFETRTAGVEDQLYIRRGARTANIHFNREPRFYAWVGFDTGVWYGQGKYDDTNPNDLFYVQGRKGQLHGAIGPDFGPVTGYIPKKYVNFETVQNPGVDSYSINLYGWPLIRLADLYLLYAEALNEAADTETNRAKAIEYLDKVRDRAGIPGVEEAWTNYSTNPNKFKTQLGLREIIHRERLIELSFEGHRFWDLRRWKEAMDAYRTPIESWDLEQREPQFYYRRKVIVNQQFSLKDYFWPISLANLRVNSNLVQNIGW